MEKILRSQNLLRGVSKRIMPLPASSCLGQMKMSCSPPIFLTSAQKVDLIGVQGVYVARNFSCTDQPGPANIVETMQGKLSQHFNGEFDHIEVSSPDAMNQQVVIFVVSDAFKGVMPVKRHRMINEILKEEIS
mmetsp:Transcript_8905/g.15103  ORF Transcript_8905/g.15103 Transcript_8905/m.15103 type:complete len:133 (+) Transcript_8905:3-401(+)